MLILTACNPSSPTAPAVPDRTPGVSWELAEYRVATVEDPVYDLSFQIPKGAKEPILGSLRLTFRFREGMVPVVLDFAAPAEHVKAVRVLRKGQYQPVEFVFEHGHLVIPAAAFGKARADQEEGIEVDFVAGEDSLNRGEDFLYTLFVPDRAHRAFPCLDQPNLKGRFRLQLDTAAGWQAVANGTLEEALSMEGRTTWTFAETPPLPTYLFSFAAGRFQVEEAVVEGRAMRFLHRETDAEKLARNREALFQLHAEALAWLEEYTGIAYPFEKFDFVLIPAFQYGGMEHPGAILYRDSSLLLDETATQEQRLGRASLIAHETAHMWFGDLVTMDWFSDVWMKEVFANFMAAKIAQPAFPELNHDLRFLLAHFPAAYAVDRTAGANPIRQPLDNLNEAGSLYGAIIYQKAPIVMRHLERIVGEDGLRTGLREYLDRHRFGNAGWPRLIEILDRQSPEDLAAWSQVWVEEPGRPTVEPQLEVREGTIQRLRLQQRDPGGGSKCWNQPLEVVLGYPGGGGVQRLPARFTGTATRGVGAAVEVVEVPGAQGLPTPSYLLPAGGGLGYGYFALDPESRDYLLASLSQLEEPVLRGAAWLALWDALLEGEIAGGDLVQTALEALAAESDAQLVGRLTADLRVAFWRYLEPAERARLAPAVEAVLFQRLVAAEDPGLKATFFQTFAALATTDEAVGRLEGAWRRGEIAGFPLAEQDRTTVALELAVREVDDWRKILEEQLASLDNPDRKARFAFVLPALAAAPEERDAFFNTLRSAENRAHEPWVLEALAYLHHPLRSESARKYLRPSLDLLEEIQRTGDIFFPKRWLDVTLGGHRSQEAAAIVRTFLDEHPDYPPRLKAKLLQSADGLFRAAG